MKRRMSEIKENVDNGCVYLLDGKQCCEVIDESQKYFCKKHMKKSNRFGFNFELTLGSLRKHVLKKNKDLSEDEAWQKEIPYDTRQLIINDFIAGYKAALTNRKNGMFSSFQMGYKSKRDQSHIFHIEKRAIDKDLNIFKNKKIGILRVRNKMKRWMQKNIKSIESNCKICKYNDGRYFLLLSISKEKEQTKKPFDVVSLDPGVRTFQTFYSPNGIVGTIGDGISKNMLYPIAKRIDRLQSLMTEVPGKTRRNMKKRCAKLRTKIKNIVNNLHWEACNFLCSNFNTIIIPPFEVKNMTSVQAKISSRTTREMLSLSHYAFRQKLISRGTHVGCNIILASEAYTSLTCTKCGNQKDDLRGSKTYKCEECGMKMDRDMNGARNIMIRSLSEDNSPVLDSEAVKQKPMSF